MGPSESRLRFKKTRVAADRPAQFVQYSVDFVFEARCPSRLRGEHETGVAQAFCHANNSLSESKDIHQDLIKVGRIAFSLFFISNIDGSLQIR